MLYDCIIIGGGIAGLQAAIQLGRYEHKVLVIDANDGRSVWCKRYHNILGYPDGISGEELRHIGRSQAREYGVSFVTDEVISVHPSTPFEVITRGGRQLEVKRLLLATGVKDRLPDIPNMKDCLGISLYVCPDCDGYEIKDEPSLVIGSGNTGAKMALTLTYWNDDILFINHGKKPLDRAIKQKLKQKGIDYIEEQVEKIILDKYANMKGVRLENGIEIFRKKGFIAFGGNKVESSLAKQLGVETLENKHILVNPRTKETSVKHVWAAGDVVAHSEQVTIAMGEGSQAAIWIHKSLIT
ncbi:MAG: NAD(P)/FAD-dependent oxidoreductase [Bacillaceae bacterium]|nr:NAD(P)/FAD-dependent oxidoreductase [Bacillaceae bacterium]